VDEAAAETIPKNGETSKASLALVFSFVTAYIRTSRRRRFGGIAGCDD